MSKEATRKKGGEKRGREGRRAESRRRQERSNQERRRRQPLLLERKHMSSFPRAGLILLPHTAAPQSKGQIVLAGISISCQAMD